MDGRGIRENGSQILSTTPEDQYGGSGGGGTEQTQQPPPRAPARPDGSGLCQPTGPSQGRAGPSTTCPVGHAVLQVMNLPGILRRPAGQAGLAAARRMDAANPLVITGNDRAGNSCAGNRTARGSHRARAAGQAAERSWDSAGCARSGRRRRAFLPPMSPSTGIAQQRQQNFAAGTWSSVAVCLRCLSEADMPCHRQPGRRSSRTDEEMSPDTGH